jgi:pSer/pThr/pTyr-binding forkhead associated (FHA) protein
MLHHAGVGKTIPRVSSPLARHVSSPEELVERQAAIRRGRPFLVYRDADGRQVVVELAGREAQLTVGRRAGCDLRLEWDRKVSRVHAELERVGDEWTVSDHGLSHNGTLVGGERIRGQRRLRDGDLVTFGETVVAFVDPAASAAEFTETVDLRPASRPRLSDGDREVLRALCRPLAGSPYSAPASNAEIAAELHLTVAAVKSRLGSLFERFALDGLPQNQKRAALAAEALRAGLVAE